MLEVQKHESYKNCENGDTGHTKSEINKAMTATDNGRPKQYVIRTKEESPELQILEYMSKTREMQDSLDRANKSILYWKNQHDALETKHDDYNSMQRYFVDIVVSFNSEVKWFARGLSIISILGIGFFVYCLFADFFSLGIFYVGLSLGLLFLAASLRILQCSASSNRYLRKLWSK